MNVNSYDLDLALTRNGLVELLVYLKELKNQFVSDGKNIAAVPTETFIKVVDKLINRIDERLTTVEGLTTEKDEVKSKDTEQLDDHQ